MNSESGEMRPLTAAEEEKVKTHGEAALLPWVPISIGMEVKWGGGVFQISEIRPTSKSLMLTHKTGPLRVGYFAAGHEIKFAGSVFEIERIAANPFRVLVKWVAHERHEDSGSMMRRLMEAPRRKA